MLPGTAPGAACYFDFCLACWKLWDAEWRLRTHHYTLNGKPLGKSDREKDLGILVNDKLTWSSQCQAAAAKANRIMGLEHPQVIRTNGKWKQVDTSLCIQRHHNVLCMPGQFKWGINLKRQSTNLQSRASKSLFLLSTANVSITTQHCYVMTSVARGAWCTLSGVTKINTPNWDYVIPTIANLSIDLKYHTPVNLQALSLGIGKELGEWLVKFNRDEYLLMKLHQEKSNATILLHHDQKELKEDTHLLENNAKGYWWEIIFGHSNAANGILNYLIDPIVILLIVSVILILLQVYMCCVTRYLYRKIQSLTNVKIVSCDTDVQIPIELKEIVDIEEKV
ncbi:unnamed protein product [Ranitomeya imitator]|uniref:Uncharacterized protein n=1 Tax=Ranitomeya imitator TaxID=111125 RepID=A0ABN9M6I2_9NEOB|nr:unnamed protein product [Ranitomeya imitator]